MQSLARLEKKYGKFSTMTVKSPSGGVHLYFRYPETGSVRSKGKLHGYPGIEVKSDRTYVLLPPSRIDGKPYRVVSTAPIAPFPVALLSELEAKPISKAIPERIEEGERNTTLVSIAGSIRSAGYDYQDILHALEIINELRCKPPLESQELETIAVSVTRYEKSSKKKPLPTYIQHILDERIQKRPFIPIDSALLQAVNDALEGTALGLRGQYRLGLRRILRNTRQLPDQAASVPQAECDASHGESRSAEVGTGG